MSGKTSESEDLILGDQFPCWGYSQGEVCFCQQHSAHETARSGLRSAHDSRPRRALLHHSHSWAPLIRRRLFRVTRPIWDISAACFVQRTWPKCPYSARWPFMFWWP